LQKHLQTLVDNYSKKDQKLYTLALGCKNNLEKKMSNMEKPPQAEGLPMQGQQNATNNSEDAVMADQSTHQQNAHGPSSSSSRYDKQKQDRGSEPGPNGSSTGGETRRKGKEREKANQEETKGSMS
jgi:hypothetical protein